MRIVKSVAGMQRQARSWQRSGVRVGFVPTMGYLHAGHLSLVRRARRAVGPRGKVVLSIYVNPAQFGPSEDFSRYPRDLARDLKLCRQAGVDVVFTPSDESIYPGKDRGIYSTYVVEEGLSKVMEGKSRPTHFRGVTTIVAKLFNVVLPTAAVFGAKDWQQAAVIRRMTLDLNFPVKIIVAPTLRERDELAMSSRNKYLEGDLRRQALALSQALRHVTRRVAGAKSGLAAAVLHREVAEIIGREPQARLDYVEFFDPDTLAALAQVARGTHMALAVVVGRTRLIDNARL
jgi:pantoate--beta-alanine ligase